MPKDNLECESFTTVFIDSSFTYENKYYLQVYLDICAYKIVDKQLIDYPDDTIFEADKD